MQAIGHFALGCTGAFFILIQYPQLLPNLLKWDTFFILGSGIWSMLPDVQMIWSKTNNAFLHQPWGNIFWGHPWIDTWTKDDPKTAAVFIALAIVMGYIYLKKIG